MNNLLHVSANQFSDIESSGHTYKIWRELSKGFDNYYILGRSRNNKFEKYKKDNITLILIPQIIDKSSIFILSSFVIFYYVSKYKISHILCQSAIFGGAACILVQKIYKIPVMVEIHGEEYFRIMESPKKIIKFFGIFLKKIYLNANKVRSLNDFMTEKLKRHGIVENVVEIYNRVDLELFNEVKQNFKRGDVVKIASVGRFVKEKNYENLILFLKNSGIKFHLTLIGGGLLKENYNTLIKKLNLENDVLLLDWVKQEEFIDILISCDLYIQSSISEGMPRTIVEAMALQLPIVSTNVGSISGVVKNEVNGLLVEPNEIAIIDAVKKMVNSESLRESLAKQGRKDVVEKYEWNKVFYKYRSEIISM
ncbi:glycosyltransferase [Chryseobacterium sp. Y16C]|uniref:glycosyltransferase n=1 Tax=Chryseobacterium sp. Y16C TaxID=2920939 RepID=UPI001F0BED8A|nr:glycosyltransferase [Chryseobacterium sp. Y16C]UMQ43808.1 glycosyltransferase [Chryseobacterium sp. Y16C]